MAFVYGNHDCRGSWMPHLDDVLLPRSATERTAAFAHDWAFWSRECFDLWNPILEKGGVQLVVTGHRHRYRHDLPSPGRSWHQVLGGGHELGVSSRGEPDEGRFPTVVEGAVRYGRLVVTVHDVFGNRIVDSFAI